MKFVGHLETNGLFPMWAGTIGMRRLAAAACAAIACVGCGPSEEQELREALAKSRLQEAKLNHVRNVYPSPIADLFLTPVQPDFKHQDDVVELRDLNLIFRLAATHPADSDSAPVLFSETEVTNRMYAIYLHDTQQFRDDSELAIAAEFRGGSTASATVNIHDAKSLWHKGRPPAERDDHPVTLLTIGQAIEFCDWLSRRYPNQGTFRLPGEDEWMAAAYGEDRDYPWGNDVRDFAGTSTVPVLARPDLKTPAGLYGMWGNVAEFVVSPYDGYGRKAPAEWQPFIAQWQGPSFQDPKAWGNPTRPRRRNWGYSHSTASRSDCHGFRVVFVACVK